MVGWRFGGDVDERHSGDCRVAFGGLVVSAVGTTHGVVFVMMRIYVRLSISCSRARMEVWIVTYDNSRKLSNCGGGTSLPVKKEAGRRQYGLRRKYIATATVMWN